MGVYRLKNLDCADCAVKIENHLKKLDDVKFVSVNFATSRLNIETENFEKIKKEIKKIEPEVEIEPEEKSREREEGETLNKKKEIAFILISLTLFITGLFFKKKLHNTPFGFAEYAVFLIPYLLSGWGVLLSAGKNIIRGKVFDENFLMTIATLGAIFIHQLPEAVGVMLFYRIGEFFQELSVDHSRKSIKALLEVRPDYANLKINGGTKKVDPQSVNVGDILIIRPGEKVPLDGEIISGSSQVDTSPLTGESVPRTFQPGDTILSGMINKTGLLTIKVTKPFKESSIARILDLVENAAAKKSPTERFITKFARYYTPVVVFGAVALAFLPPLITGSGEFYPWIYRALILLVISCPCALVVSIPLGYFGGVGLASRRGILVKGSNYLDTLSEIKTVVFDKTGTLTKGVFRVTEIIPENGFTADEVLSFAALAESHSNHPIAKSILEAYDREIDDGKLKSYREIAGHGVVADVDGHKVLAGNDRLLHLKNIAHERCRVEGTVVHVAVDNRYAGYIVISDELKEDAPSLVPSLKKQGVKKIIMLTGDSEDVAESVAKKIGIDEFYAELLPEQKVEILETLMAKREGAFAFVGDGINDAPVIARADVGIAMGGLGSDAAIEIADVVIMTDAPSKVSDAIKVGKKVKKIIWENIIFALAVKLVFISLGAGGLATIWEAVFADVGVTILAVFNSLRILRNRDK